MGKTRIIIMAKAPMQGFAKTRLIPALGEAGAASLAQRLLFNAVASALGAEVGDVMLCATPAPSHAAWKPLSLSDRLQWACQGQGDLGERMARACEAFLLAGERVLLMGADCPGLTSERLGYAAKALHGADAVIVPAHDGGYALLGLKKFEASLFEDIAWGSAEVLSQTLAQLEALQWSLNTMPAMHDIDEAEDLAQLPKNWFKDSGNL